MKIWEARLVLGINDEDQYVTRFNLELAGDKFKENNSNWSYADGWLVKSVPKDIDIYENYGNVVAKQGFGRELSEEELENVKIKMKEKMLVFLAARQQQINKIYDEKIRTLLNMEEGND